jgi:outer membrane murein-binding lipoprotein Lpp
MNIDRNTDGLSAKVDALGSQIRAMRSDVNDIAIKGVNIKR